ncbi:MAG TPA: hypothetical protein VGQ17_11485 [Gemmatimonadales bacterium]|jgi:hypothetical protein|nr:hypothetical protein [Gemmatimonadales bacterium]
MSYRRSPRHREVADTWVSFVQANAAGIAAAGLPGLATKSIEHWDDLLMHGTFDHHEDPSHFAIKKLTEAQYGAFVTLVDSYFAAGYEYFTPMALRPADQDQFAGRHGSR